MRLFVAIEIETEIRRRIEEFVSRLKPGVTNARWVRPEGMHITLKFLGSVADERESSMEVALRKIQAASFPIRVRNIGVFPNAKSPRVLWVGTEAGPELAQLAERVDERMAELGFEREKRAFAPHVTLARFNERDKKINLNSVLAGVQPSFGTMTAREFHLYESKLSPQGSRYSKLASFALT
ncbi:MAG TPA: RNA 2',3'-cyclic phosphodiesterase [Terriglobales bacterium]|nr:RNA 2',3'-cyclic phosphodiesterase [Terriglobales bacterium]